MDIRSNLADFRKFKNGEIRCITVRKDRKPTILKFYAFWEKQKLRGYVAAEDMEFYSFLQIEQMDHLIFRPEGLDYEKANDLKALHQEYMENYFWCIFHNVSFHKFKRRHRICLIKKVTTVKWENHVYENLLKYKNKKNNEKK